MGNIGRPRAEVPKITLSVKIPVELKTWLAGHCEDTNQSAADIITELLKFYRGIE